MEITRRNDKEHVRTHKYSFPLHQLKELNTSNLFTSAFTEYNSLSNSAFSNSSIISNTSQKRFVIMLAKLWVEQVMV